MKIYITIAAILIAGTAFAQKGDRPQSDICKDWGDMAVNVMRDRQSGRPLHELMAKASSALSNPLLKNIILRAYERPIYPDKTGQFRAIADFRNDIELLCYKSN